MSTVADRLRAERNRLNLTQAAASNFADVTREQWSRYEAGSMPNADVLVKLMDHGFDVAYILGGVRSTADSTLTEPEWFVVTCRRCTDAEGRDAIDRAARMEALRVGELPPNPYTPPAHPPTSGRTLHEPPPSGRAAPRPSRRPNRPPPG